jgi:hypothetical protein
LDLANVLNKFDAGLDEVSYDETTRDEHFQRSLERTGVEEENVFAAGKKER